MRASTNNKKNGAQRVSLLASCTSLPQKKSAGGAAALCTPPFTSPRTYLAARCRRCDTYIACQL